jgi:hypothetical protein
MSDQGENGRPPAAREQLATAVDDATASATPQRRPTERVGLDCATREAPWLSAWAALERGQIQAWKRSWRR